eukprot:7098374-Lingulodinium_polyedra.AAC.1
MGSVVRDSECASSGERVNGEDFSGKMIPLGAAVTFRPNEAQGAYFHKFDAPGRTGVFAGYCLKEGPAWNGQYM